jgi:hypothetical protein
VDSSAHFPTGDKSWFYLAADYETIWLQEGEERPIRRKNVSSAERVIIAIFASQAGIPMIDKLPNGEQFNSQCFGQNVPHGLSAACRNGKTNSDSDGQRFTSPIKRDVTIHERL